MKSSNKKIETMKIAAIIIGVLILGFVTVQFFAMKSQKDIETYPYKVIEKYDQFEVREYEAGLFTSVKLSTQKYEESSGSGFRILAGYIFGGNDTGEKIAMTSPVTMSLEDSMTMMFMVPRNMEKEDLPKPNNSSIEIREVPPKTMAAITFGGWANSEKIEEYKQELIAAMKEAGVEHGDKFYFFGYNPPYEVVNRRNEVLVEIASVTQP